MYDLSIGSFIIIQKGLFPEIEDKKKGREKKYDAPNTKSLLAFRELKVLI